jgi:hypothetical protein
MDTSAQRPQAPTPISRVLVLVNDAVAHDQGEIPALRGKQLDVFQGVAPNGDEVGLRADTNTANLAAAIENLCIHGSRLPENFQRREHVFAQSELSAMPRVLWPEQIGAKSNLASCFLHALYPALRMPNHLTDFADARGGQPELGAIFMEREDHGHRRHDVRPLLGHISCGGIVDQRAMLDRSNAEAHTTFDRSRRMAMRRHITTVAGDFVANRADFVVGELKVVDWVVG